MALKDRLRTMGRANQDRIARAREIAENMKKQAEAARTATLQEESEEE